MVVHLGLNDNRKYKVEKYKEEIVKFVDCRNSRRGSASKRLLLSYRNASRGAGKESMHSQSHSQRIRPNATLMGKISPQFQSAHCSPQPQ